MGMTSSTRIAVQFEVEDQPQRWLLEDEDVPETPLHDLAIDLLVQVLRAFVRRTGRDAYVARNLGCRWDPDDARVGMDPDIALLEPAPVDPEALSTLRVFEADQPTPRLAIEVVSPHTADKDYGDAHLRAARLGVDELWVFDPELRGPGSTGGPFALQVWRRVAGALPTMQRVHAGEGPAASPLLGAWLVTTEGGRRLRLADDPEGARLWTTPSEQAEVARREAEVARNEVEAARARAERAEAELGRLRSAPGPDVTDEG